MKHPDSGPGIGMRILRGICWVYFLGAVVAYIDYRLGFPLSHSSPEAVQATLSFLYAPFFKWFAEEHPDLHRLLR